MCGSPERVAADAFVPGNVPDATENTARDGEDVAPDVPGDGKRLGGDAVGGAGLERCGKREGAGHLGALQKDCATPGSGVVDARQFSVRHLVYIGTGLTGTSVGGMM